MPSSPTYREPFTSSLPRGGVPPPSVVKTLPMPTFPELVILRKSWPGFLKIMSPSPPTSESASMSASPTEAILPAEPTLEALMEELSGKIMPPEAMRSQPSTVTLEAASGLLVPIPTFEPAVVASSTW